VLGGRFSFLLEFSPWTVYEVLKMLQNQLIAIHIWKKLSLPCTSHNTGSSYTAWANFYLHLCALHITAGVALYSFYQDVGVIK
jgi:hypothetical protein